MSGSESYHFQCKSSWKPLLFCLLLILSRWKVGRRNAENVKLGNSDDSSPALPGVRSVRTKRRRSSITKGPWTPYAVLRISQNMPAESVGVLVSTTLALSRDMPLMLTIAGIAFCADPAMVGLGPGTADVLPECLTASYLAL